MRLGATIRFGLSVAAAAVALAGCGGGGSTSSGSTSGSSTSSFNSAYVQVTGQYHLLGAQLATFINNLANHKLTTNGALVFALQPIDRRLKALNGQLAALHPPANAQTDFAKQVAIFTSVATDMDRLIAAAQANGSAALGRADTVKLLSDSIAEKAIGNRVRADVGLPAVP